MYAVFSILLSLSKFTYLSPKSYRSFSTEMTNIIRVSFWGGGGREGALPPPPLKRFCPHLSQIDLPHIHVTPQDFSYMWFAPPLVTFSEINPDYYRLNTTTTHKLHSHTQHHTMHILICFLYLCVCLTLHSSLVFLT